MDLIDFFKAAAQMPMTALALFEQALEDQLTFIVSGALLFIVGGIFGYCLRKHKQPVTPISINEQTGNEQTDPDFIDWYEARKSAVRERGIAIEEGQARRLYRAYLSNTEIISMQIASEAAK